MEGSTIGVLGVRVFQIICGAVVLGVSIHIHNVISTAIVDCKLEGYSDSDCNADGFSPSSAYAAFVGAWGLVEALLGITAAFVSAIPWIVVIAFDALALVFYFAGGVRFAVLLSDFGGYGPAYHSFYHDTQADEAFLWIGFLLALAAILLVFLTRRGGSGISRSSTV